MYIFFKINHCLSPLLLLLYINNDSIRTSRDWIRDVFEKNHSEYKKNITYLGNIANM